METLCTSASTAATTTLSTTTSANTDTRDSPANVFADQASQTIASPSTTANPTDAPTASQKSPSDETEGNFPKSEKTPDEISKEMNFDEKPKMSSSDKNMGQPDSNLKIKRCKHGRIIVKDLSKKKTVPPSDKILPNQTAIDDSKSHASIQDQTPIDRPDVSMPKSPSPEKPVAGGSLDSQTSTPSISTQINNSSDVVASANDNNNNNGESASSPSTADINSNPGPELSRKELIDVVDNLGLKQPSAKKSPRNEKSRSPRSSRRKREYSNSPPPPGLSPRADRHKSSRDRHKRSSRSRERSPSRKDRSRSPRRNDSKKSSSKRRNSRHRSPRRDRSPSPRYRQLSRNRSPKRRYSRSRSRSRSSSPERYKHVGSSRRNQSRSPERTSYRRNDKYARDSRRGASPASVRKTMDSRVLNPGPTLKDIIELAQAEKKQQEQKQLQLQQQHQKHPHPNELKTEIKLNPAQSKSSPKEPLSAAESSWSSSSRDSPSSDIYDPEEPVIPISPGESPPMSPAVEIKLRVGGGDNVDQAPKVNDDELPSSAVQLNNQEKYLQKLNRQERVIEEVKIALRPFYNKRAIDKDQYKDVLRRAVPKVCHSKNGEINPVKIRALVEAYVKKMKRRKVN